MSPHDPKQGDTYRSRDGSGRITYDPAFYRSRPWATFHNGTACNSFGSFVDAVGHLSRAHGIRPIIVPKDPAT